MPDPAVVGSTPGAGHPLRPLLVTADEPLLDDVLRLAAAAPVALDVAADAGAARPSWSAAPLVLVGDDAADQLGRYAPLRRPDVVLLARSAAGTGSAVDPGVWRRAVAIGADQVFVLPEGADALAARLADAADGAARDAPVVGVIAGRGGAGASTLAAALAVAATRRRLAPTLLDVDPAGGGLDIVLGGEAAAGVRWPELAATHGRVNAVALRDALPHVDGIAVCSCDRSDLRAIPAAAMRAVVAAARRGGGLVVADLPRHVDAAAEEVLARCADVLLVVPAEVRAVAAAARVAATVRPVSDRLRVVVRRHGAEGPPAAAVAAALDVPLAGELSAEPHLAVQRERGEPPGRHTRRPLGRFCDAYLADLPGLPPAARPEPAGRQVLAAGPAGRAVADESVSVHG